jgi:hypothetical protein
MPTRTLLEHELAPVECEPHRKPGCPAAFGTRHKLSDPTSTMSSLIVQLTDKIAYALTRRPPVHTADMVSIRSTTVLAPRDSCPAYNAAVICFEPTNPEIEPRPRIRKRNEAGSKRPANPRDAKHSRIWAMSRFGSCTACTPRSHNGDALVRPHANRFSSPLRPSAHGGSAVLTEQFCERRHLHPRYAFLNSR